jgi:hypothetical protein
MAFKRQEEIPGEFAQRFIDKGLPVCPLCRTTNPCWTIDAKPGFLKTKYLFKCSECEAIISTSVEDAICFLGINPPKIGTTIFNWTKPRIVFAIENKGNKFPEQDQKDKGKYTLKQLKKMAEIE